MQEMFDVPSPNFYGRSGTPVDVVLLHHTGPGSESGHLSWLRNPKPCDATGKRVSRVSAHYLVGTTGKVWRLVDETNAALHAGLGLLPWEKGETYNFNLRSIGIHVVNPGDGVTPFTEAQYLALERLVSAIARRLEWDCVTFLYGYTINLIPGRRGRRGYILGHRDIAPGRKTGPADNFNWQRIKRALGSGA
jgi:N-acetylmuramoyl-L-alanine amidase